MTPKNEHIETEFCINADEAGERLDSVIVSHLSDVTRSQIKRWIDNGNVLISGQPKKTSYKVKKGDVVVVIRETPSVLDAIAQDIPLDIIYEDKDIIVVNKPSDMVVHPAAGNPDGTLVNALLNHCKDLSGIGGVIRPGIVHRLDKGTSGVIIVAKNDAAHNSLAGQFKSRSVGKVYIGLIYGVPKKGHGTFDMEIGRHPTDRKRMSTKTRRGRSALTDWELIQSFGKDISYVKITLHTGRTHQIRVHFSAAGMPLVGDAVYGGKKVINRIREKVLKEILESVQRPMLHALRLTIKHPTTDKEMVLEAEMPKDFKQTLEALRATSS